MPGATVFAHSGRDLFYNRANEQSALWRISIPTIQPTPGQYASHDQSHSASGPGLRRPPRSRPFKPRTKVGLRIERMEKFDRGPQAAGSIPGTD